jgi:hypothetical protein
MKKKYKKLTHEEYRKAEVSLAFDHCPTISPCEECGYPKAYGYCCEMCGN